MLRVANTTMAGLIVLLSLGACVSTTLDTGLDHPANPKAKTLALGYSQALLATPSAGAVASPSAAHTMQMQAPAVPPSGSSGQANKPPAAEVWTCPMHPEISRPGPGKCPICGMNLVKREGAGH